MKTRFIIILAAMALVFTSCGNNAANNAEQAQEAPAALEIDNESCFHLFVLCVYLLVVCYA